MRATNQQPAVHGAEPGMVSNLAAVEFNQQLLCSSWLRSSLSYSISCCIQSGVFGLGRPLRLNQLIRTWEAWQTLAGAREAVVCAEEVAAILKPSRGSNSSRQSGYATNSSSSSRWFSFKGASTVSLT